jgi:hypothetical protein
VDCQANDGDELALLFGQINNPRVGEAEIRALVAAGERSAAVGLIWNNLNHSGAIPAKSLLAEDALGLDAMYIALTSIPKAHRLGANDARLLDDMIEQAAPYFDPGAKFMQILHRDQNPDQNIAETAAFINLFLSGLPPIARNVPEALILEKIGAQLALSPSNNRPLAALKQNCSATCPAELGGCIALGMGLAGGYEELRRLSSPTETIIPHNAYVSSPRAAADLQRWIRDRATIAPANWRAPYRKALSCFDTAFPADP